MGRNGKKNKADIAYQNKDVASKVVGEALEGKSLAAFGLPYVEIMKSLPTNLPVVESNELRLDHLFLLGDGAVGIIDYESDYSEENFIKYLNYAARVISRYAKKKQLEQLQLMILPLTVKGKENKQKLTVKAVELARQIKDRRQETEVLAGILTFADKVIDEECRRRIKEEIEMTQIAKMIYDDGVKVGTKIGFTDGENSMLVDLVCRKLRKGKNAEEIAGDLEKEPEVIREICQAAKACGAPYDSQKVLESWKFSQNTCKLGNFM